MFDQLKTPLLLLDSNLLEHNCKRMNALTLKLGVKLRPHLKTCKSADVARIAVPQTNGICVSTIGEAGYFAKAGFDDILYTVGLVPAKVDELADIARNYKADIACVVDNIAAIEPLAHAARSAGWRLPLVIEIDVDGYRAGMGACPEHVARAAQAIAGNPSLAFRGLMSFPGMCYTAARHEAVLLIDRHRAALLACRQSVLNAGIANCNTSIGSTPGTFAETSFEGLTETRAGVYMFMDLAQASYGICNLDEMAVSVLASVISVQPERSRVIIDAGALALSQDRSTAMEERDFGYGLVVLEGQRVGDATATVESVSQEHGIVSDPSGDTDLSKLKIGDRVRVYPNHVCMMAAAHDEYVVVRDGKIADRWQRHNGW